MDKSLLSEVTMASFDLARAAARASASGLPSTSSTPQALGPGPDNPNEYEGMPIIFLPEATGGDGSYGTQTPVVGGVSHHAGNGGLDQDLRRSFMGRIRLVESKLITIVADAHGHRHGRTATSIWNYSGLRVDRRPQRLGA